MDIIAIVVGCEYVFGTKAIDGESFSRKCQKQGSKSNQNLTHFDEKVAIRARESRERVCLVGTGQRFAHRAVFDGGFGAFEVSRARGRAALAYAVSNALDGRVELWHCCRIL